MQELRNQILCGDCVEILRAAKEPFADLIFADPPFNIGYKYDKYHDEKASEQYLAWTRDWIGACVAVLKPQGSFYIAIGDEYAAEVRVMMRQRAALRNWVIWRYTFGQCCKGKFNRSHAHLFYFVKDAKNFTFNADAIRVPSDRQLKYDDARANPAGKLPDDVWTYSRVCGTFKERVGWHPCQMPIGILRQIVTSCSQPGDVVFDPFAGSGTTLVAAAQLGRRWLGTELSEQYAAQATARVAEEGARPYEPGPKPVVRPWRNRHGPEKKNRKTSAGQLLLLDGAIARPPRKRRSGVARPPDFEDEEPGGPASATGT